jgi:hypothetical protein
MKKLLFSLLFVSSSLFAQARSMIMQPTMLRINYGDSSIEYNLPYQYASANQFQVMVTPTRSCPVPPQVSLLAQYDGNQNWYSLPVDQGGFFRHNGFKLRSLRLLFRQYNYQVIDCEMSITGQLAL